MKVRRFVCSTIIYSGLLAALSSAIALQAATVTWDNVQNVSGPGSTTLSTVALEGGTGYTINNGTNDVNQQGAAVLGLMWDGHANINWPYYFTLASDGTAFLPYDRSTGGVANTTQNGLSISWNTAGGGIGPYFSSTTAELSYGTFLHPNGSTTNPLQSAMWGDSTAATISLDGLNQTHQYLLQFWVADARDVGNGRNESLAGSDSDVNSPTLHYNQGSTGSNGQWVVGRFTGDATGQQVLNLTANASAQVNLFQVRDVTGLWSGQTDGTWAQGDMTTQNFSGMSFTQQQTLPNSTVYFADQDAFGNTVMQSTVVVQAGGVMTGKVVFQNNSVPYTLQSADANGITGPTAVAIQGRGEVIFAGPNTYTGGTAISAGVLSVATFDSLPGWNQTGQYSVAAGGALAVSNAFSDNNIATILGTGNFASGSAIGFDTTAGDRLYAIPLADGDAGSVRGLVKVGDNTLTLTAASTYTGGTTITGGTLQLNDATLTTSGITNNSALVYNLSGAQTVGYPITGNGSLTKAGIGGLTLTSASPYTGATTVNGGTLTLQAAIPNTSLITVGSNGTFQLGDTNLAYQRAYQINGGAVQITGGIHNHFGNITFTGGGSITTPGGAAYDGLGNYALDGNSIRVTSGTATLDASVGIHTNSDPTFTVDSGAELNITGILRNHEGNATGSIRKAGNGLLVLAASNAYTGATTVNGGTLAIGPAGSINPASAVTVGNGATFAVSASPNLPGNSVIVNPGGVFDTSAAGGSFALSASNSLAIGRPSLPATDLVGDFTLGGGTLLIGGPANTVGTVTLANNLTLGGGMVKFDLSSDPNGSNDLITAANLNLNVPTVIDVNLLNGSLGVGNYSLIRYSGTLSGGTSNLTLNGLGGGTTRQSISLATTAPADGALQLQVAGTPASLVWTGAHGSNWDVKATQNWFNTGSAAPDVFYNLDSVLFDDSGATGQVALNAVIQPGSMQFNNSTLNYTVSGSGSIVGPSTTLSKSGAGLLVLATTGNTFGGGTTVNGGTLQLGDGTSRNGAIVGDIAVAGGAALVFSNPDAQSYGGTISGNGTLTKNGVGTLTLGASNSYAGGTTINGGVVQTRATHSLGDPGSAITVNSGATLDVTSADLWDYTQAISLSGTGAAAGAGALSKSASGNGDGLAIRSIVLASDASIGGIAGARIDIGRGDWNGGNLTTGNIHIDGQGHTLSVVGGIYLGILASAQNLPAVNINDNATIAPHMDDALASAVITFNGGTLSPWGNHVFVNNLVVNSGFIDNQGSFDTYTGTVQVNGPLRINTIAGGNITMSGNVSGSGSITKIGGYSLFLSGDNSGFTGAFTNNESNTFFNSATAGSALATWVQNAGNLANTTPGDVNIDLGALGGSGGNLGNNTGNSAVTFTIGALNSSTTFGGSIVDSIGGGGTTAISKVGSGTLTLTGNSRYTGVTTISGGTLQIGNGGSGESINGSSGVNLVNNTTLAFNHADVTSLVAPISGTGNLFKTGGGTLALSGSSSYTGSTTVDGGTLRVSAVAGAARLFDASKLGLADGGAVTAWNDLSGNNANATVPSGNGTPTYIADAGTGTGLGAIHFNGGSVPNNNSDSQALSFARDTNVRSVFSIFKGSSFLVTDSASYSFHRPSDGDPTSPLLADYSQLGYLGTVYVNGAVVNPTGDAMPTADHNGYNLVEVVGNGAAVAVDSLNKDRVYHSGDQSQAEVVIFDSVVSDAQRQQIEAYLNYKWFGIGPGSGNLLPTTTPVTLSHGGTLDLTDEAYQTVASISATDASGTKVMLGATALTAGNASNTAFDGAISGPGSLTKIGSGRLLLSGANTYTGGTTVLDGTLDLTSSAAIQDGTALSVGSGLSAFSPGTAAGSAGVTTVPEPGSLVLLGAALCGAAIYRRATRRKES